MRIGSLFSGYGGLEQGVQSVLGGSVAWHSEIDPGACKILAHRYPDVPNLGDITTADWAAVEPVDVLTGGSPCQDVSAAGKRLGMRAGTRSGLWASMCDAIDIIRPGLVVWENVRGVLSAGADSAVEPCPICVGDERDSHLRALGRVVGDLSELGYVGRWTGLRAADVGAPHGRYRVFVTAWPATDPDRVGGHGAGGCCEPAAHSDDPGSQGREPARGRHLSDRRTPAHPEGHGRHEGRPEPARLVGGPDAALGGDDAAADTDRDGLEGVGGLVSVGRDADGRGGADGDGHPAQRTADADAASGRGPDQPQCSDPAGLDVGALAGAGGGDRAGNPAERVHLLGGAAPVVAWGPYAAAIHRWERVLGRPAPAPTELSAKGSQRLSPRFVEFLMGLPAGWVTDVPGLSRNDQLKALGNGVVPQQAAAALRLLLPDMAAPPASVETEGAA